MASFQIAIDGPVSAGKGTVSRLVSEKLGFLYVDTGAMYRVTGLLAHKNGVDVQNEAAVAALVKASKIEMRNPTENELDGRLTTVLLDGEDVSWQIRTQEVSGLSSQVAKLPEVRKVLVQKQQEIAAAQNVIMEGRDISYRVLPNANLKIYLTAELAARAQRRYLQLEMRGEVVTLDAVKEEIAARDEADMSRAADPLKIVPEAWVLDTTGLEIDAVVNLIVAKAYELGAPTMDASAPATPTL